MPTITIDFTDSDYARLKKAFGQQFGLQTVPEKPGDETQPRDATDEELKAHAVREFVAIVKLQEGTAAAAGALAALPPFDPQ